MDIEKIIIDSPLYSKWKNFVEIEEDGLTKEYTLKNLIEKFDKRVELYCTKCDSLRVFAPDKVIRDDSSISSPFPAKRIVDRSSMFKTFRCSGHDDHIIFYSFIVEQDDIIKIAEYPSKYDSVKNTFNNYKKILDNKKIQELAKAAQLESFGYAIASLLHYRRIFEGIILQTFSEATLDNKIAEEEFRGYRMEDKVKYLKDFLPEYFQENSQMYGTLSKGIHELEEDECREYLPIVKTILFYSLDEAVDKRNNELRKIEMAKKLQQINSNLK